MKKTMLAMALAVGLFATSCNNEKPAEGTHTHEDGTVHGAHEHAADTTMKAAPADTAAVDTAHSHAGHSH